MLLTLGGGGGSDVQRSVQSTPYARGGWGHAPPSKILKFRPSEIPSGAFSSKFTLPMICIYYTLLTMQQCIGKKKTVATKFQGGANAPPP